MGVCPKIRIALLGVAAGLLLVGFVSHTPVRHLVQISPVLLALVVSVPRPEWTRYAALPVCLVWLFLMFLIWLYLLGITNLISGTFSTAEVVLTVVIGLSGALGAFFSLPGASVMQPVRVRIILFTTFLALQVFALWLSFRPEIAVR